MSDSVLMNCTQDATVPNAATVSPCLRSMTQVSCQDRLVGLPPVALIEGRMNGAGSFRRTVGCWYGAPVTPYRSILSPVVSKCPRPNGEDLIGVTVRAPPPCVRGCRP